MEQYVETDIGRWNEAALRLLPRGKGSWHGISHAHTYAIDNKPLATVRKTGSNGWMVRIEGFEWRITEDMGAARFQKIPSSTPLTHTSAKLYSRMGEACKAVENILRSRPVANAPAEPEASPEVFDPQTLINRSATVSTVGELRALLAKFPDDFALHHPGNMGDYPPGVTVDVLKLVRHKHDDYFANVNDPTWKGESVWHDPFAAIVL